MIVNENQLHTLGNSVLSGDLNGRENPKERMYVYIQLICFFYTAETNTTLWKQLYSNKI